MMNEKIPLVDLKTQYRHIRSDVLAIIDEICEKSAFIGGTYVQQFEAEFARFCGAPHAVGCGSGTAALHLALMALGVKAGDEVIVPSMTFIATAEAVVEMGAKPVFVDCAPDSFLFDIDQVKAAINERTRAIIPVHLYGEPIALQELATYCQAHKIHLIEDCAQAHGACIQNTPVGLFGDVGCFSFYPGKNLGAYGDAGACITQNAQLAQKIKTISNHGRENKYEHFIHGFGHRLDALQAGILSVKMKHLQTWTEQRQKHAKQYLQELQGLDLELPQLPTGGTHVFHLFVIKLSERDRLMAFLRERGIESGIHYPIPLHLQPVYQPLGYKQGSLPQCEKLAKTILSLPLYPELSQEQISRVCDTVRLFFKK